jgi:hypothetical protein
LCTPLTCVPLEVDTETTSCRQADAAGGRRAWGDGQRSQGVQIACEARFGSTHPTRANCGRHGGSLWVAPPFPSQGCLASLANHISVSHTPTRLLSVNDSPDPCHYLFLLRHHFSAGLQDECSQIERPAKSMNATASPFHTTNSFQTTNTFSLPNHFLYLPF